MGYAVRNDGVYGWRSVDSAADCAESETYSETQPAPYAETDAGKASIRKTEIVVALTALDAASVRPLRAILTAQAAGRTADAADLAKLADLAAQAVTLRADRAMYRAKQSGRNAVRSASEPALAAAAAPSPS